MTGLPGRHEPAQKKKKKKSLFFLKTLSSPLTPFPSRLHSPKRCQVTDSQLPGRRRMLMRRSLWRPSSCCCSSDSVIHSFRVCMMAGVGGRTGRILTLVLGTLLLWTFDPATLTFPPFLCKKRERGGHYYYDAGKRRAELEKDSLRFWPLLLDGQTNEFQKRADRRGKKGLIFFPGKRSEVKFCEMRNYKFIYF